MDGASGVVGNTRLDDVHWLSVHSVPVLTGVESVEHHSLGAPLSYYW
jgi:hypothetical protein